MEDFDAAVYGISPPEAVVLDPQHRLMLEVNSQHILALAQFSISASVISLTPVIPSTRANRSMQCAMLEIT